jgi:deoxyribonuclease V
VGAPLGAREGRLPVRRLAVRIRRLHRWDLTFDEARAVQIRLSSGVRLTPVPVRGIRFIAGSDIAVSARLDCLVAAVVVMSFPDLRTVETRLAVSPFTFPYVPGYLSFREIPALIKCLEAVRTPFDVMLCDGQGIAHPRGFGLASHLGLTIDRPTVGCAKSRLVGEHDVVGPDRGPPYADRREADLRVARPQGRSSGQPQNRACVPDAVPAAGADPPGSHCCRRGKTET